MRLFACNCLLAVFAATVSCTSRPAVTADGRGRITSVTINMGGQAHCRFESDGKVTGGYARPTDTGDGNAFVHTYSGRLGSDKVAEIWKAAAAVAALRTPQASPEPSCAGYVELRISFDTGPALAFFRCTHAAFEDSALRELEDVLTRYSIGW